MASVSSRMPKSARAFAFSEWGFKLYSGCGFRRPIAKPLSLVSLDWRYDSRHAALADQTDGGLSVGQLMAKSRPGLPVVYTTGRRVTDGIVKQFVEPSKFIPKPYTGEQLVGAAAELLRPSGPFRC
jgi:hypothetical protein